MSTATVAAGNVRPLTAIKADMANVLANKPESLIADAKAALTWLPRKAYAAAMRTLRWLHVPQAMAFARANFAKFLGIVGKGPFAVEMLTSHWGQKTITKGLQFGGKLVGFAVKWSWKIATSPLRLFTPTRGGVEKVEAGIIRASNKLTPNSGETFGPLQIARDTAGYYLSADRKPVKFARTTAVAVMAVRLTRRFTPAGWMRIAAYILDGVLVARSYDELLENTWLGKKLTRQVAIIESDVLRQGETVVAEATHMTREAATDVAGKLRAEADRVEAEGIEAARAAREEMTATAATQANELRSEADALEATAERMSAAETAAVVTENLQAAQEGTVGATATVLRDRPKPGPSVPPAATPSTGPAQQPHQRHGGQQRPPKPKQR